MSDPKQQETISLEDYAKAIGDAAVDAQSRTADNGLRDSFASSALNALIVANNGDCDACMSIGICLDAYKIADNMMKAKGKKSTL